VADGRQRITIAIAAMGGQGGGVLADWIVDTAERSGYYAQATSVPGVAQRTGSTIYYLELFPHDAAGVMPVLALMPVPGDVDIVIAAELVEAGRAVQRGIVTPDRTTLIASSHRAYALTEKSAMGDGRKSPQATLDVLRKAAHRVICADMQALADAHHTVISATLFGALGGSAALPFAREQFEAAIKGTGKSVANNIAAFNAAFAIAATASESESESPQAAADAPHVPRSGSSDPAITALLRRVDEHGNPDVRDTVLAGLRRVIDYQDPAYATLYLDRLARIEQCIGADAQAPARSAFGNALARHLALWMSYEDTIRVADLKIRRDRFERCREEVRASEREIVYLTEYMHPRVEEVADTLPASAGRWLLGTAWAKSFLTRFVLRERTINTSKIGGFLLLYRLANLRRFRRTTYRFSVEQDHIEHWLDILARIAPDDIGLATEIALCQNLIKGYGDTHARGMKNFKRIMAAIEDPATRKSADDIRKLREAALADERGEQLDMALSRVA
jgi:indolepyruvate ferredoxin oxidoreductase beta subunit